MRKSNFTEEQIINILKSVETGQKIADACRANGISEQTYHRWKAKYGGLEINEVRRLKQLEQENFRLKQIVADLTLDNRALKEVVSKKW
jgi:putative transposase